LKKEALFLLLLIAASSIPAIVSRHNMFFWDTVQLASKHASWFYAQNLKTIFLPNNMDSGHIPVFGYYLAILWKLLGKNLIVSHLSMLPFLWLTAFYSFQVAKQIISGYKKYLLSLLILIEPTYLAQSTLVSPDIWLVAFFMMHLWAILSKNLRLRGLSAIFLALISLRGIMVLAALELFLLLQNGLSDYFKKRFWAILPALFIWLAYQIAHYVYFQWIGWHNSSPWAESFSMVGGTEMLYNLGIFIWRLIDFGRLSLWLIMLVLLPQALFKPQKNKQTSKLFTLLLILSLSLLCFTLPFKGLMGHRYFIPVYITAIVFSVHLIDRFGTKKLIQNLLFIFLFSSFFAGHFIVYPPKIAQGWDASLAYLPFIKQEQKLEDFLSEQKIKKSQVVADFPVLSPNSLLRLTNDTSVFKAIDEDSFTYIVFSNVFNNFTDAQIACLKQLKTVKDFSKGSIILQLKRK